jgi:hypothetical protein
MLDKLLALPAGSHEGQANGRRWIATKTLFGGGRSMKLVAEALDGEGYISANLYLLQSGPQLHPCEMPAQDVIDFVLAFETTAAGSEELDPFQE